ncbi:MAG: molybdopterin cofactor-binding domain-containing protein [Pseudomonadota bacterium]
MFTQLYQPGVQTTAHQGETNSSLLENLSRRGFIAGAGGLVIGVSLATGRASADSTAGGLANVAGGDATPSLFIAIEPDGAVKITCHRSEMGQQTWTAMAQIIADELEADWTRIEIIQAEGHPRYGDQNTDGSRSVRRNLHRLRVAGAAMRTMLEQAAAEQWNVDPAACSAEQHVVTGPDGQTLGYGELAEAASALAVPAENDIKLKDRADWRYIGKETPSLTVPMITRGQGVFGQDVQLPDMLYAVIARPPQVFGRVTSLDDKATLATDGVLRTVQLAPLEPPALFKALGGVAVVAQDTWAAIQGRRALSVEWDAGENADYNSEAFADAMLETARQPGEVRRKRGDIDQAFAAAANRIEAEYYAPHLSQSPMEPPAATARWTDGKVECWACVQAPQAARSAVAQACGVPEDDVTINVTWLGGGFGRKSKPDFVVEAALIAREAEQPVKVIWTREDDIQHGYYHTVSAQKMEGGLDADGNCTAFLHRTVFPPIPSTFQAGFTSPSWGELRLGATDNPFAVPNMQVESGEAPAKVRIGWLRSVANVYHAFAVQSFAAELAHAAGRDPKDYLLELIGPPRLFDPNTEGAEYDNYGDPLDVYPIDTGRLANVVRVAADMADWGRALPEGSGLGIAVHRSFLSYVATVIEASVDSEGRLTIPNVWSAIDAGTVVNRRHTTAQVEGGTLYGLSNALFGSITAEDGAIVQRNFPEWRLMRMNEAPRRMSVQIIDSDAPPGGVGEPPTPPAAPALTNAIFAATGTRIRRLPVFGTDRRDRIQLSTAQDS